MRDRVKSTRVRMTGSAKYKYHRALNLLCTKSVNSAPGYAGSILINTSLDERKNCTSLYTCPNTHLAGKRNWKKGAHFQLRCYRRTRDSCLLRQHTLPNGGWRAMLSEVGVKQCVKERVNRCVISLKPFGIVIFTNVWESEYFSLYLGVSDRILQH